MPLAMREAKSSRARHASTSKAPTIALAAPNAKNVARGSHGGRALRGVVGAPEKGTLVPAMARPTHVAAASTSAVALNAVSDLRADGRHTAGCKSWRCIAADDVKPCPPRIVGPILFPCLLPRFFFFGLGAPSAKIPPFSIDRVARGALVWCAGS
nr:hypothetical protein [Pandoravirus massiliensis]